MRAVVLVHGWLMGSWSLRWVGWRLKQAGFQPILFSYRSRKATVHEVARELLAFCQSLEVSELHMVGHSLGGLVILDMLQGLGADQSLPAGHVVLLGSPVGGCAAATGIARYAWGRWLLGKASEGLKQADYAVPRNRQTLMVAGTRAVGLGCCFAPLTVPHDGTVACSETELPGAHWVTVHRSHSGLLISQVVLGQIVTFLEGTARHNRRSGIG